MLAFSCDPVYQEEMNIHNRSGMPLTFSIKYNEFPNFDTFYLRYNNPEIFLDFFMAEDSAYLVLATIEHDQHLVLHQDGGVGYVNFDDSQSALSIFKETYDTIFLENKILNKAIMNFDNWNQKVERPRHSSYAYFNLDIFRGDVQ